MNMLNNKENPLIEKEKIVREITPQEGGFMGIDQDFLQFLNVLASDYIDRQKTQENEQKDILREIL